MVGIFFFLSQSDYLCLPYTMGLFITMVLHFQFTQAQVVSEYYFHLEIPQQFDASRRGMKTLRKSPRGKNEGAYTVVGVGEEGPIYDPGHLRYYWEGARGKYYEDNKWDGKRTRKKHKRGTSIVAYASIREKPGGGGLPQRPKRQNIRQEHPLLPFYLTRSNEVDRRKPVVMHGFQSLCPRILLDPNNSCRTWRPTPSSKISPSVNE